MGLNVEFEGDYAVFSSASGDLPVEFVFENRDELCLAANGAWTKSESVLRGERVDARTVRLDRACFKAIRPGEKFFAYRSPAAGRGFVGVVDWPEWVAPPPIEPPPPPTEPDPVRAPTTETTTSPPPTDPVEPPPGSSGDLPVSTATSWRTYLRIAVLALLPLAAIAAPLTVLRPAVAGAERWVCARPDLLARAPGGLQAFVCGADAAPDAAAYASFRQCVQDKPACVRRDCADAYLNDEPKGSRRSEVTQARAQDDNQCRVAALDAQGARYQAFESCLSGKAACAKQACIDKYRLQITVDPFAAKLHDAAAAAEQACLEVKTQRQPDADDDAYKTYSACSGGKTGCALRACAQGYLSDFPIGRHAADMRGVQALAQMTCDEDTQRAIQEQSLTQLENCMTARSGCAKKECMSAAVSITMEPFVSRLRKLQNDAEQECAAVERDQTAYQSFRDCVSAAPACNLAGCDARYGALLHDGPYAAGVSAALQAGKTACANAYDTAARDFLARFYELHRNGALTTAAQWIDMCAPRVRQRDIKGKQGPPMSPMEFANSKVGYFRKNRTPSYRIDDQTINVDCDQTKRTCEISADVYIDRWRRRVTLDLIGLPEHPRLELEALLAD